MAKRRDNCILKPSFLPLSSSLAQGCQMAIARFLDRMCLALRASGQRLRTATLKNLIASLPWIALGRRAWGHTPRKGRGKISPSGNLGQASHSKEEKMVLKYNYLSFWPPPKPPPIPQLLPHLELSVESKVRQKDITICPSFFNNCSLAEVFKN